MLTFKTADGRFNFRVGAILLYRGHVLLQRALNSDFWFTLGGRVEFGESTEQAVIREMHEELGEVATVDRLLWISENFFRNDEANFLPWHELAFYYLVSLPANSPKYRLDQPVSVQEGASHFHCQWLPLDQLDKFAILPLFLAPRLQQLSQPLASQPIEHIVERQ